MLSLALLPAAPCSLARTRCAELTPLPFRTEPHRCALLPAPLLAPPLPLPPARRRLCITMLSIPPSDALTSAAAGARAFLERWPFPTELPSSLPSMRVVGSFGVLREVLAEILDFVRPASVALTAVCALLAVVCGLLLGDRTAATSADAEADATLLAAMPKKMARRWDHGKGYEHLAEADSALEEAVKVSPGLWVELAVCVGVDLSGLASYFFSRFGELSDLGFAVVNAFVVELFFDWPAMAVFAFWEELLPFTDFIPSTTLAWILVVTNGRKALRALRGLAPRKNKGSLLVIHRLAADSRTKKRNPIFDVGTLFGSDSQFILSVHVGSIQPHLYDEHSFEYRSLFSCQKVRPSDCSMQMVRPLCSCPSK
ncbi:hypothetical protein AB1Y20_002476 [Prymnesium parvum]|uniref:Uncharacterized protein n=1 Tax=Prymnesium parvum TaxID=97485 RepID=A0AB34J9F6_PRYPA